MARALRDRRHKALVDEHGDRTASRVRRDPEQPDKILLRRQQVNPQPELARLDALAQPRGYLPVGRLGRARI
jgi:hypothetical protein